MYRYGKRVGSYLEESESRYRFTEISYEPPHYFYHYSRRLSI